MLDVGCGLGRLCVDVALDGAAEVAGLDYEARQIEFARESVLQKYPQVAKCVAFHAGELRDFAGGDFDLILCEDSFEHIMDLEDAPIRSIRDVGLNMNSIRDYQRILRGAGLTVASFLVNRSHSPLSKVLSVLRRIPALTDGCTHNTYCVLEKPDAGGGN